MFGLEHLTASSSSNPPPTVMILSTGAPARSLSDKKRARSALFSLRATKLDQDLGSGTEPSSIILWIGAWPQECFFLVAHLIDVALYLSNVTSVQWKSFPETKTAFTNYLSMRSLNVLQSEGLPSAITSAWSSTTSVNLPAIDVTRGCSVPLLKTSIMTDLCPVCSWLPASKMARRTAISSWLRIWSKSTLLLSSYAVMMHWRVFLSALMAAHFSKLFFLTS